jgi:cystathionine gamma-synthase
MAAKSLSPPYSQIPLGSSVPALTSHAISVSLPLWEDNIGYEEGHKRVVEKMETGYPRFFIHRSIQKVRIESSTQSEDGSHAR